ncbi:MAG: hypothetical protein Q9P14_12855 [candidate division KSB1 bacterium]|nr:hypothetical protein [candidate division KSB1 bacterium]
MRAGERHRKTVRTWGCTLLADNAAAAMWRIPKQVIGGAEPDFPALV